MYDFIMYAFIICKPQSQISNLDLPFLFLNKNLIKPLADPDKNIKWSISNQKNKIFLTFLFKTLVANGEEITPLSHTPGKSGRQGIINRAKPRTVLSEES